MKRKSFKFKLGPEAVLNMRRGRTFVNRKKQQDKYMCRKRYSINEEKIT